MEILGIHTEVEYQFPIKPTWLGNYVVALVSMCSTITRRHKRRKTIQFPAVQQGNFDKAVDILKPVRYKVVRIGGSNAQVTAAALHFQCIFSSGLVSLTLSLSSSKLTFS